MDMGISFFFANFEDITTVLFAMTTKTFSTSYEVYSSMDELSKEDRELCQAALEGQKGSYAPYSHFNVGAAVRLSSGVIVKGSNQENAAYPSGLCAERTTMFWASANYPNDDLISLAVCGGPNGTVCDEPASPCGACRQVMAQYQIKSGKPMSVILIGGKEIWKFSCVDDILPFIFTSLE